MSQDIAIFSDFIKTIFSELFRLYELPTVIILGAIVITLVFKLARKLRELYDQPINA